jgi:hypothetical protein
LRTALLPHHHPPEQIVGEIENANIAGVNTVQRGARHSKETGLSMLDLQSRENPATHELSLVAGAGVSGSSPLVGSLEIGLSKPFTRY